MSAITDVSSLLLDANRRTNRVDDNEVARNMKYKPSINPLLITTPLHPTAHTPHYAQQGHVYRVKTGFSNFFVSDFQRAELQRSPERLQSELRAVHLRDNTP